MADQRVIVLRDMGDLVFGGIGLGAFGIARRDGDDLEIGIVAARIDDDGGRDLGGAQDADTDSHGSLPRVP